MIKFIKSLFKNEYLDNTVNGCENDKTCTRYDHLHKVPVTYTPAQESIYAKDVNNNFNALQLDCTGALLVDGIEDWTLQLVPMDSDSLDCSKSVIGPDTFLRVKDAKTGAIFLLRRES